MILFIEIKIMFKAVLWTDRVFLNIITLQQYNPNYVLYQNNL